MDNTKLKSRMSSKMQELQSPVEGAAPNTSLSVHTAGGSFLGAVCRICGTEPDGMGG